ncbi:MULTISPECIES: dihydroxyacetone kinase subunit DhaL [unclassified Paenibacillus]|uniref:dihydroxyacetone kinase subunit DhaL n=1 Tax=unclassified Paenibacillus TaxID=185978 RepID=UPI001C111E02|nr:MULTISPECIES: dihydroxyacetone kinase subunit DhaL [unclassified Paenibacillus]MBU5444168.1 dihydroxyacetone kinase subunit L [Paenibacillus sp. MSJ-34]CAH0122695.1 PEP-dependent dihydroxyacetone kinase, ADP-binding subunit DhaL [Paenibacillus sp. CECT 9249]
MVQTLSIDQTRDMFLKVAEAVIGSKELLTEIDSQIGDGDHGIGMSIGFTAASEELRNKQWSSVNEIFQTTGMSMIKSMGGASGVIFGTMFMGGVKGLDPMKELDLSTIAYIWGRALTAIKVRGKAELGDKTMIDALQPAVEALRAAVQASKSLAEGLKEAEEAAAQGVENTKSIPAKFGRAKSLGERAIGYRDAGATTVWIMMKTMREWVEGALVHE